MVVVVVLVVVVVALLLNIFIVIEKSYQGIYGLSMLNFSEGHSFSCSEKASFIYIFFIFIFFFWGEGLIRVDKGIFSMRFCLYPFDKV